MSSEKYILSAIEDINQSIREIKYNQIDNTITYRNYDYDSKASKVIRNEINLFKSKHNIKEDLDIITDDRIKVDLFDYLKKYR